MTLEEVKSLFRSWDEKAMKKAIPAIEADDSLKTKVLEYYADILKYTGGKALADILKIPKNLATKKVRAKKWEPNANSIEILNHLKVDYLSLWSEPIPVWVKHTHFRSLSFVKYKEEDIVYPISVNEFELRECDLESIPEAVRNVNAKYLAFSGNRIKTIPDWVFETAERLDADDNRIENIELIKDSAIDTLRLSDNKLTDVSFLVHFPRLDFLVLSNNRISDFPTLPGCPLRYLYLDKCDFTKIPVSVNVLQKLSGLYIQDNPITMVTALKMPNLDGLDISGTPIGQEHNIQSSMYGADTQAFLNRNKEVDNSFVEVCRLLESCDMQKVEEAYGVLRANEAILKKAEKRYLKFIRARLGAGATIFDFGKAMYSESETDALRQTINKNNLSLSLGYLDNATSKMLVDFLGSILESVTDLEALKKELAGCASEEQLAGMGNARLQEIRNAIYEITQMYKDGWFGQLLYNFSSQTYYSLGFDHTHFDLANTSAYAEAFFVFLQCFATDDYYIDVFQSDAPRFGEIFWLLPYIPKVIWFDVTPVYPLSPLSFKRSASLSENNAGKRIKSKLASEAAIESVE